MQLQTGLMASAIVFLLTTSAEQSTGKVAHALPTSASNARIVNTTTDSAPGWLPSTAQSHEATQQALAYLAARDSGHAEAAFAMLDEGNKALQKFDMFVRELAIFNKSAGPVLERRIVNVTWTKNPANAPKAGVYAALDTVSRYKNIDRDCGYIVVYQPPSGGSFFVMREEANTLSNAEAANIERQHSKAAVEAAWVQLSARCPNYPGESPAIAQAPLPEQDADIGYATVAAALNDLRSRPGFVFTTQGGYTIGTNEGEHATWVFTSEGQPAYPAAIKREIRTDRHGGSSLEMKVLCEASKAECDGLVRTFQALNARMTSELRR